jgi:uncharacterized protein YneF (UPF0154 family)
MFIDSDDWVHPDMVKSMYDFLVDKSCDIVACDMEYVWDNGLRKFSSGGDFYLSNAKDNPSLLMKNHSACNKLYKASLFDDIEFPKGLWYEDIGCVPIVISKARKVGKINEVFYYYYQRDDSIVHTPSMKIFDIYDGLKLVQDYFNDHPKMSELLDTLEMMYIENGLNLSMQRIIEYQEDRYNYLKKNIEKMDEFFPNWRNSKHLKKYTWKHQIIYFFLKKNMYKSVLFIFDLRRNS